MTPHFRSPWEEGKKKIHFHPSVLNFVWNFSLILVLLPFCVSLFYRKFSFFSPPTGRIRLDPDCVSCFFPSLSVSSSIRRQYYHFFVFIAIKRRQKNRFSSRSLHLVDRLRMPLSLNPACWVCTFTRLECIWNAALISSADCLAYRVNLRESIQRTSCFFIGESQTISSY